MPIYPLREAARLRRPPENITAQRYLAQLAVACFPLLNKSLLKFGETPIYTPSQIKIEDISYLIFSLSTNAHLFMCALTNFRKSNPYLKFQIQHLQLQSLRILCDPKVNLPDNLFSPCVDDMFDFLKSVSDDPSVKEVAKKFRESLERVKFTSDPMVTPPPVYQRNDPRYPPPFDSAERPRDEDEENHTPRDITVKEFLKQLAVTCFPFLNRSMEKLGLDLNSTPREIEIEDAAYIIYILSAQINLKVCSLAHLPDNKEYLQLKVQHLQLQSLKILFCSKVKLPENFFSQCVDNMFDFLQSVSDDPLLVRDVEREFREPLKRVKLTSDTMITPPPGYVNVDPNTKNGPSRRRKIV